MHIQSDTIWDIFMDAFVWIYTILLLSTSSQQTYPMNATMTVSKVTHICGKNKPSLLQGSCVFCSHHTQSWDNWNPDLKEIRFCYEAWTRVIY